MKIVQRFRVYIYILWMFPKIVVPQNGWFIKENLIKMDDLGVPLFLETPRYVHILNYVDTLTFPTTMEVDT